MLKKIDVSNQITGLRPKVKQAIVHLAHHLTREIKKCDNRKGVKAERFIKKAESHRKEVLLLKQIEPDTVSKYALMMDFSAREKLLGDINLPLDTKVIIKLASAKPVVSHVENFRADHSDWRSSLPPHLDSLGIRTKHKKKVQKQQEKQKRRTERKQAAKENAKDEDGGSSSVSDHEDEGKKNENVVSKVSKSVVPKKPLISQDESDENEDEGSDVSVDKNDSDDDSGNENISEDADQNGSNDEDGNASEDEDGNPSEDEDENVSEDEDEDENVSEDEDENQSENEDGSDEILEQVSRKEMTESKKVAVKQKSKKKSIDSIPFASKFAEVRRFADLLEEETEKNRKPKISIQQEPSDNEKSDNDNEPVEEDTFFMTGENSFLKTVAVKRDNGEGLSAPKSIWDTLPGQWSVDGKTLRGNRAERRAKFLGKKVDPRKARKANRMDNGGNYNKLPRSEKDNDRSNSRNQKVFGNKKEFSKPLDKISGRRSVDSHLDQPIPEEKLHPSWEAKRKQKISLDNFQGKKIKFGDD